MKPWEANIRKVVPYTPGEQPNESGMIKLYKRESIFTGSGCGEGAEGP